jgi:hypothetical protein
MARDDFTASVIRTLAARVNLCCSNPGCHAPTSGPDTGAGSINVGVAAHITAASPGGPRYEDGMAPDERASAKNGIWLCQRCAKQVDSDPADYGVEVLQAWKITAEHQAARLQGKPLPQPAESESARKLRLIHPHIGSTITYSELANSGREQLVRGRYRSRQDATIIDCDEVCVTVQLPGAQRSIPLERIQICKDTTSGRPELQECTE